MELRLYQKECANNALIILKKYSMVYLSIEVRCGKTLISMEIASIYNARNVLFVTKKKAISSIENDYKNMGYCFKINIINYESLHKTNRSKFDLVIIDEAHKIGAYPKPCKAQTQLKKICENTPIIYLSATATPESFSQIYHQLDISSFSPFKEYKNFYVWAKDYVNLKKKYIYNREINDYSNAREEDIRSKINYLFVTFTQGEAGFNQEVREEVLYVNMKPQTTMLSSMLMRDKVFITKSGAEILGDTAVKLMSKIHQISSGSVIAEDGSVIIFDTSKADFIKERFRGQKIAIYYKFQGEKTMLESVFDTTSSPEEFRDSDKVFISHYVAGREGVNLSCADCLVMFNIDFASLSRLQTLGRLQDKNREKEAVVYWVFSKDGIESKIYDRVKKKEDYTLHYYKKDFMKQ